MWSKKSCAQRGIGGEEWPTTLFFGRILKIWASAFTNTILVNIWQHCKHYILKLMVK
jgi:hypothetical protein